MSGAEQVHVNSYPRLSIVILKCRKTQRGGPSKWKCEECRKNHKPVHKIHILAKILMYSAHMFVLSMIAIVVRTESQELVDAKKPPQANLTRTIMELI